MSVVVEMKLRVDASFWRRSRDHRGCTLFPVAWDKGNLSWVSSPFVNVESVKIYCRSELFQRSSWPTIADGDGSWVVSRLEQTSDT